MIEKQSVLFVCTHNSARSQMAEGLLRDRFGEHYDVYSAGTEKTRVRPLAIDVMREIGIDISGHTSKTVKELSDKTFDFVITVCDSAQESCPCIPARKKNSHQSFDDPSGTEGSDEHRREVFRRVRDEIADWIEREFAPAKKNSN